MALQKTEAQTDATKDFGVSFDYHKIESVNVSDSGFVVNLASYKDQAARDAAKVPLDFSSETIALDMGENIGAKNLHTFLYGKLKDLARFSGAIDV